MNIWVIKTENSDYPEWHFEVTSDIHKYLIGGKRNTRQSTLERIITEQDLCNALLIETEFFEHIIKKLNNRFMVETKDKDLLESCTDVNDAAHQSTLIMLAIKYNELPHPRIEDSEKIERITN